MRSKSLNRILLIGNVTADPQLKEIPGMTASVSFIVTTQQSWLQEGVQKSVTELHRIVAVNKLAEAANQLTKGALVFIEGRLHTRHWLDPEQRKQQTTEVIASEIIFLTHTSSAIF